MKYAILFALSLVLNIGYTQTARSKQSISISPKSTWIAVGKSAYGQPYEITISKFNDRGNNNSDGTIYRVFTLNSMLHNEYFSFLKDVNDKVIKTSNGFKLNEDEITETQLTSDDPLQYNIKHSIFQLNDSLAKNYGTIKYRFNPVVSSINFYDEKTLIIYNNLGIFALYINKIQNGKFVNEITLLQSSEFSANEELISYYRYKQHSTNELIVEKVLVKYENGEEIIEIDGNFSFNLQTKTLVPYGKI